MPDSTSKTGVEPAASENRGGPQTSEARHEPAAEQPPTARSLILRSLAIQRFLGIRTPDQALIYDREDLSPGVTLIVGPNGSGKTTTAKAIERALWPDVRGRDTALLTAEFSLADEAWSVEVSGSRSQWLHQEEPASSPVTCPAEERRSYRLSLHELLAARDEDLAERIRRELDGGYSLAAAMQTLNFTDRPVVSRKTAEAYRTVREKLKTATEIQRRLRGREEELAGMRRRAEEAEAAKQTCALIRTVLERRQCARAFVQARRRFSAFDPRCLSLRGNEADALREVQEAIISGTRAVEALRARVEEAEKRCRATEESGPHAGREDLEILRLRIDRLRQAEENVRQAENEWKVCHGEMAHIQAQLAEKLEEKHLRQLARLQPVEAMGEYARAAMRLEVDEEVRRQVTSLPWIQGVKEDTEEATRPDTIRRAIDCLTAWLAEPDASEETDPRRRWLRLAAMLGLVLALPLVWLVHWSFLPVAGIFLAIVFLSFRSLGAPEAPSPQTGPQQEYDRLGIPPPESWERPAVRARLESLIEMQAENTLQSRLAAEAKTLTSTLEARAKSTEEEWERCRQEVADCLGILPSTSPLEAWQLVARIAAWQKAGDAETRAREKVETEETSRQNLLREIGELCERFGGTPPSDSETAAAERMKLEQARTDMEEALRRRETERKDCRQAEEMLHENRARRDALLREVELADHTPEQALETLRDWLAKRPEARKAEEEMRNSLAILRQKIAESENHGDHLLPLRELSTSVLEERLREEETLAAGRETLLQAIWEVEKEVELVKGGHQLADLLAERDQAEAALRRERDQGAAAMAGKRCAELVGTHLEAQASGVLGRVQTIFGDITRQRYTVVADESGGEPRFKARDMVTGVLHDLDTLSSGTRVQLLVAARLAFLTEREGDGPRLPLVLDEVLGNSDDLRAGAMLDAMVAAARSGRQIISFTAQRDECERWLARLRAAGVPHAVVRLGPAASAPPPDVDPTVPNIPSEPEPRKDESYLDYARRLHVPRLDPRETRLDALHLWYVVDSSACLYRLLSLGYRHWGQIATLLQTGGEEALDTLLPPDAGLPAGCLKARAMLYGEALSLLRQGRGRTVTPLALEASGAVSARFLDEVGELARQLDGDAEALLEALEEKRVKGFRNTAIARLRQWFETNGYLDSRPRVSADLCRAHLHTAAAPMLQTGVLELSDIERVMQTIAPLLDESVAPHHHGPDEQE